MFIIKISNISMYNLLIFQHYCSNLCRINIVQRDPAHFDEQYPNTNNSKFRKNHDHRVQIREYDTDSTEESM